MKKVIYICDRCRKEIVGGPIKIIAEILDPENEDFTDEIPANLQGIRDKHFCMNCTEKVIAAAQGLCVKKEFEDTFIVPLMGDVKHECLRKLEKESKTDNHDLITECLSHYGVYGIRELSTEQLLEFCRIKGITL